MLPSGKGLHNYGKSPFVMGKSTISITKFSIANCKRLPEGTFYILISQKSMIFPLNPIKSPFSYGFPMVFQRLLSQQGTFASSAAEPRLRSRPRWATWKPCGERWRAFNRTAGLSGCEESRIIVLKLWKYMEIYMERIGTIWIYMEIYMEIYGNNRYGSLWM